MLPDHPGLTGHDVLTRGGWHPRYARVLAVASDADYGFAVVDGNGDGAELEAEAWRWDSGSWNAAGSSGAGPLGDLGPLRTGGHIDDACFAYGSAPGRQTVTISFDGHRHDVPSASTASGPSSRSAPAPATTNSLPWQRDKNIGTPAPG